MYTHLHGQIFTWRVHASRQLISGAKCETTTMAKCRSREIGLYMFVLLPEIGGGSCAYPISELQPLGVERRRAYTLRTWRAQVGTGVKKKTNVTK